MFFQRWGCFSETNSYHKCREVWRQIYFGKWNTSHTKFKERYLQVYSRSFGTTDINPRAFNVDLLFKVYIHHRVHIRYRLRPAMEEVTNPINLCPSRHLTMRIYGWKEWPSANIYKVAHRVRPCAEHMPCHLIQFSGQQRELLQLLIVYRRDYKGQPAQGPTVINQKIRERNPKSKDCIPYSPHWTVPIPW